MIKNTGKAYEELTQQVFSRLLSAEGSFLTNVQRDVRIQGRSIVHQIDVTFEFTAGLVSYRTIVQCKDWRSAVKQEQVLAFNSVLTDIPGQPRGIIVSRSGFQEGARKFANDHGIKLYELREPRDEDWTGLIREVVMDLQLRLPRFDDFNIIPDKTKIRAHFESINHLHEKFTFNFQGPPDRMFTNAATNEYIAVTPILNSLVPKEGSGPFEIRHLFAESVLMATQDKLLPRLPVLGFEATAHVRDYREEIRISTNHLVAYILQDVLTGDMKFVRVD